jgi:hypothetical protein
MKRRDFLKYSEVAIPVLGTGLSRTGMNIPEKNKDLSKEGFVQIFNGKNLDGWHKESRLPIPMVPGSSGPDTESATYRKALTSKGLWTVEDGAIVGGQDPRVHKRLNGIQTRNFFSLKRMYPFHHI